MIQGTKEAYIESVTPVNLHGQMYFDVAYRLADDLTGKLMGARVADDAIYAHPKAKDKVVIHYLMGIVMKIEKARAEG